MGMGRRPKREQVPDKVRRSVVDMPLLSRANHPRSPPVKEDDYEEYILELNFEPTEDGRCLSSQGVTPRGF